MKKYHLFLPLLGILLLVSGGCSKRKEPKPLITEAPAVETEIGGYITETESSTPESQSVSGTIRLPIQEPEHQNESKRSKICLYEMGSGLLFQGLKNILKRIYSGA